MNSIFKTIKPEFFKHQSLPNLEIELRLGKKNGTMFDTNIGEEKFFKIKEALDNFKNWENIVESETSSYFSKGKRLDINEKTEESKTIIKKRIFKSDHILENEPLDVRCSIAIENPTDDFDSEAEYMRNNKRTSYIRNNLSIDLTIISGDTEYMDDEEEKKYEIEFEIIDPSQVSSDSKLFNIIFKIQCILKTL